MVNSVIIVIGIFIGALLGDLYLVHRPLRESLIMAAVSAASAAIVLAILYFLL